MSHPTPPDAGYRALTAIRRIVRQVSRYSRSLSRSAGVSVPQVLCLRAIDQLDLDEVTLHAVADEVQLSRSTTSTLVDQLVQQGWVDRQRSTCDRRRICLSLTATGRKQLDTLPMPLQDRFIARLNALPADEREQLLGALEKVVALMDAEALDASPVLAPGAEISPASD